MRDRVFRIVTAALPWLVTVTGALEEPPHERAAREALAASDHAELERIAGRWIEDEPQSIPARTYLAVARASQRKFAACARALQELVEAGGSVDRSVPGVGVPLTEVVNRLYSHVWANWSPEANRECFGPLFAAFPDRHGSVVPAARLLMAALKLGDTEQTERLESWFDARLESPRAGGDRIAYYYAQAYARAGIGGDRPFGLARRAFEEAWQRAANKHGYDDETTLERRERCDLSTDAEYNVLALAAVLAGRFDPERNPLAAREPEPDAVFDDVTDELGLGGVRAARVAVGDFDEDGYPDLCFSGRLFRNERGRAFTDVSKEKGAVHRGSSALFGDYDDDGDLDLLVPARPHPRLLRNAGRKAGFTFEDATGEAGLDRLRVGASPEGAAWLDADGDGRLDFYLAVYEEPMSTGHRDLLARNVGDGTFRDATEQSGLLVDPPLCGRGVTPGDFDDDGDVDLYISNYRLDRNLLFRNDGAGSFVEVAAELGVQGVRMPEDGHYYGHTIGSCSGDVDGDGDLDLFTANLAHPRFVFQGFSNLSMLYVQDSSAPKPRFRDERRARGIRFQETHSDPAFADIDNDGDLDLSITCIYEGVPTALYRNDGTGRFAPVSFRSRAVAFHGWGQAWFDLEGDGDLDWLVASSGGVRLFRNRGNDHHWLAVRLEGKRGNRFGVGARVTVTTIEGDDSRSYVRELASARGTTSQDGEVLHFGLGNYRGRVRVAVRWPDTGQVETRTVPTDRTVRIRQVRVVRKR